MSLSDNKKRDIPIYWDWPLETGSSPSEIEDNDEIDTTFIGKTMSMQIATIGTQVTSNPYANGVASTTIDGKITVYNSVQDAIDAAGNNVGAIITIMANEVSENISIASGQNVLLDLNGNTLKNESNENYCTLKNYGLVDVFSSKTGGILSGTSDVVISNEGTFTTNKTSNINQISIINNSTFEAARVVLNESSGTIILNKNTIAAFNSIANLDEGKYRYIVLNSGVAIIQGATLKYNVEVNESCDRGISIPSYAPSGRIIINSGLIEAGETAVLNVGGQGNTKETAVITISGEDTCIISSRVAVYNNINNSYVWMENGILKGGLYAMQGIYYIPQGYHRVYSTEIIDSKEYNVLYLEKD